MKFIINYKVVLLLFFVYKQSNGRYNYYYDQFDKNLTVYYDDDGDVNDDENVYFDDDLLYDPSDSEFDDDIHGRIVGGVKAKIIDYPFFAALEMTYSTGEKSICGGTIVSKSFILTAAHCMGKNSNDNDVTIFVGMDEWGREVSSHKISKIFYFDECKKKIKIPKPNDIALIQVKPAISLKDGVKIATLDDGKESFVDKGVSVIGFGSTDPSSTQPSKYLMKADLILLDGKTCSKLWKNKSFIESQMICAKSNKAGSIKDHCTGDSGGPLVAKKNSGQQVVIGVVTFGDNCGKYGIPGVYMKVSKYLPWIKTIIGKNH